MSTAKLPSVLADDKMEIIQAGRSAGVGVRTWRWGLNLEGHLEEWQGCQTHGQALSTSAPPCYLENTREGKKSTFSPYTTMSLRNYVYILLICNSNFFYQYNEATQFSLLFFGGRFCAFYQMMTTMGMLWSMVGVLTPNLWGCYFF